jgi:hypothetical protein
MKRWLLSTRTLETTSHKSSLLHVITHEQPRAHVLVCVAWMFDRLRSAPKRTSADAGMFLHTVLSCMSGLAV